MKKNRVPIPADLSAHILFLSDRTCCICRERGKAVQIHHIDDDPSNNDRANLAVLCLEDHNDTQISGGFGKKLNALAVIQYRDDWLERVKLRRETADKLASERMAGAVSHAEKSEPPALSIEFAPPTIDEMAVYVRSLPDYRKELLRIGHLGWDTGVTDQMRQSTYDYIDALQAILNSLGNFYPPGTFQPDTQEFFAEQIALRFAWHHTYSEPLGPGTRGKMVSLMVGGQVIADVESMIKDMVFALVGMDDSFDWEEWETNWNAEE